MSKIVKGVHASIGSIFYLVNLDVFVNELTKSKSRNDLFGLIHEQ